MRVLDSLAHNDPAFDAYLNAALILIGKTGLDELDTTNITSSICLDTSGPDDTKGPTRNIRRSHR